MGPYSVRPKQVLTLTLPGATPSSPAALPITLEADVYYPEGNGPFPVLLMRQPYGRAIASTVVYAHPTWYASHGYIVVIQDVRGRGSSGGEFDLFRHEAEDGDATVRWAATLPQSSGAVGMYGFSYQGMTQLYAASRQPEPLKALAPAMVGYDLYADWAYENGALLLQAGLGWACQLAAETARRQGNTADYQALYQAAHQSHFYDAVPAYPDGFKTLAPDSFWHDWVRHPQPDAYWQALRPDLGGVDVPMLHIGGWFDPYLRGDLRLYRQMRHHSQAPQHLWIGPWGHLPWSRRVGAVDYGPEAENPVDRLQLRWFDHWLKGKAFDQDFDQDTEADSPVRLFEMGRNQWRSQRNWPEPDLTPLYLHSSGLAGMRQDDGQLQPVRPAAAAQDVWVHDPWRPVPALGGHSAFPAGSFDRAALDGRSDVLTYTTAPLSTPWRVMGTPVLTIYLQADAPSFDLSATLSQVEPDGRVMNLTQGYGRVDAIADITTAIPNSPDHRHTVTLSLQPTCFSLLPGQSLRLSLAASAFPAYPVNSGTGRPLETVTQMEHRVITITVIHGGDYGSWLGLPLG